MKTPDSPDSPDSPGTPAGNTWALLTNSDVTWRQATEGGAILTALSVFAVTAAVLFKAARVMRRPRA